jgi:thiopurine S-methyltransferase
MDAEFWHERWRRGEIGFHQHDYNHHMEAFTDRLGLSPGAHVFVPLCGKSRDMIWLQRQGYAVTGVEIDRRAVLAFFSENGLDYRETGTDGASRFRHGTLTIHCADLFTVDLSGMPPVAAVYDRASLVALPETMRLAYVRRLADLVPPTAPHLLITLDYPPREMDGPPFAVTSQEVAALYGDHYDVVLLHSEDCLAREPHFRKKGLSRLEESVYLLRCRPSA